MLNSDDFFSPCFYLVVVVFVNETPCVSGLIILCEILEMALRAEFVFLKEGRLFLKLSLIDSQWPKTLHINKCMKLNNDDKAKLLIDGSEIYWWRQSAVEAEFRKSQEICSAFAEQCKDSLDVTPRKRARWTGKIFDTN